MLWENFLIELLTRIGKTRITKKKKNLKNREED